MKKYKIGRYHYIEITEDEWSDIFNDDLDVRRINLITLSDYDGEPLKYFLKEVLQKDG